MSSETPADKVDAGKGFSTPVPDFKAITERICAYYPKADLSLLTKAHEFASKVHKGQVRRSGEPFYFHPLSVAYLLSGFNLDPTTIAAGLLVDVIEEGRVDRKTLTAALGKDLTNIVSGLTKIGKVKLSNQSRIQAESFRRMIIAASRDLRVLIVKLADACQNMRTLQYLRPEQQRRISREALEIYAPLAHRMGINRIKTELEQLAFYYLEPDAYADVNRQMTERKEKSQAFFDETMKVISRLLKDNLVQFHLESRVKSHYSIHRKMLKKNRSLEGIYDYYAYRILTETLTDCYRILGLLHGKWRHIPGRIKDFIATPKDNLYQSLHTTLISDDGTLFEVQIRTHEMHRFAEEGIAAHWSPEKGVLPEPYYTKMTSWLKQINEEHHNIKSNSEYLLNVKGQLQAKNVLVLTPNAETKSLPQGSTALDLAYFIHTKLGHEALAAKVNGEKASLKTRLKSGDIVEIIRDPKHIPTEEWLKIAKTRSAKDKIKLWLGRDERKRAIGYGQLIFRRELEKYKGIGKPGKDAIESKLSMFGLNKLNDFFTAITKGQILVHHAVKPFLPKGAKKNLFVVQSQESRLKRAFKSITLQNRKKIFVRGQEDPLAHLAKCCNPIIGDPIVGYINKGKGISVHKADCGFLGTIRSDRTIDLEWDEPNEHRLFRVQLKVFVKEQEGMLAGISQAIASAETNICQLHAASNDEESMGVVELVVQINSPGQLAKVIDQLEKIPELITVERI